MRLGPLKGCHRVGRGRGGGGGKDKKNAKGRKREKREEKGTRVGRWLSLPRFVIVFQFIELLQNVLSGKIGGRVSCLHSSCHLKTIIHFLK